MMHTIHANCVNCEENDWLEEFEGELLCLRCLTLAIDEHYGHNTDGLLSDDNENN